MMREWQKLSARFDALLVRERVLVLFAAIVGPSLTFDALAIQPLEARKKRMTSQLSETRQTIKLADAIVSAQGAVVDPNALKRSYRDALRTTSGPTSIWMRYGPAQ